MKKIIILIIALVVAYGVFVLYYSFWNAKPVACTVGAKICSDGSSVGRVPPKCDFAPCPTLLTLQRIENVSYDVSSESVYFSKGDFGPKEKNYDPTSVKLINGLHDYGIRHKILPSRCEEDIHHAISIAKNSNNEPLVSFGDLDGDGLADALVILNLTYKETNMFCPKGFTAMEDYIYNQLMLTVLLNKGSQLVQVDSYMKLDPNIKKTAIDDGVITVVADNTKYFKLLSDNKLVITNVLFESKTVTSDWKTYSNSNLGVSFKYPSSLSIDDTTTPQKIILSDDISVAIDNSIFDLASCVGTGIRDIAAEITINNSKFYMTGGSDAGMGHYYSWVQYSAVRLGKCYKIELEYSGANCDVYLPLEEGNAEQAKNYNDCLTRNKANEELPNILNGIISTFQFTDKINSSTTIPSCKLSTDKSNYFLGDIIKLTWSTSGVDRVSWYQPIDDSGIRKNIIPPQQTPGINGFADTIANIVSTNEPITMKVAGPGGFGVCSANISVAQSDVRPSIKINAVKVSPIVNPIGNADVTINGTAINGGLYNDSINIVLLNPAYSGLFDEASVYNIVRGPMWYSGGAELDLRQDDVYFKDWSVNTYAPAGITAVRILAYPFYSSSTTSPTQPLINVVIRLTAE